MSTLYVPRDRIKHDVPDVVDFCVDEIRKATGATGKKPLNKNDIHNAAVEMTLKLVEIQEQIKDGSDDPEHAAELYQNQEEIATNLDLVMVQAGTSEKRKGRTHIHEMATKLQRTRVAQEVYGVEQVICRTLDGRKVRHHIAQQTEDRFEYPFDDGPHCD